VEGDSDFLVIPHIAKCINPEWDCAKKSVSVARVYGKSSFNRYRSFFERFEVNVPIVTDLDFLIEGCAAMELPDETLKTRDKLIKRVDELLLANGVNPNPGADKIKKAKQTRTLKDHWIEIKSKYGGLATSPEKWPEFQEEMDGFFTWEKSD